MIERYTRPEMALIWSEERKIETWLLVERLVVEAWAREGEVPAEVVEKIRMVSPDLERMRAIEREAHHDVISFLRMVQEQIGPEGRFVHLGLTSSDVLDTALAVQIRDAADVILAELDVLLADVEPLAVTHKDTLIVGRTHGIHAEPTTFGLKVAIWVDALRRARARFVAAAEEMRVGAISGAVGTHATVPPSIEEYVCKELGLRPAPVSSQVIGRDRHAQFMAALALAGGVIEQMALELRHLQRTEVSEAFEPFAAGQQGSSAMPHKRNPELAERVCGLVRVLRGYALTAMEDVALWHERDISHSSAERIIIPDGTTTLHYLLWLMHTIIAGIEVDEFRMRENLDLTRGLIYSQRVLLALVDAGMGRQEAYKLVQRNAQKVWRGENDRASFLTFLKADPEIIAVLSPEQLDALADPAYYTRYVDVSFRRLGLLPENNAHH
jgi:adenylosuccinate lyase